MSDGLSIGRVISRGIAAIARAPAATLLPSLVFGALPVHLLNRELERVATPGDDLGGLVAYLVASGVGLFLSTLIQGRLARPTMGREGPLLDVRALPSLVGVSAAVALAGTIGLALMVVPGLFVIVLLAVAATVAVAEGRGVGPSLGRSLDLTRGARWRIVALFGVLTIGGLLYTMLINLPAGLLYGDLDELEPTLLLLFGEGAPEGYGWFTAVAQAPVFALWGTAQTALYLELREWKEGPEPDRLAEIFS